MQGMKVAAVIFNSRHHRNKQEHETELAQTFSHTSVICNYTLK